MKSLNRHIVLIILVMLCGQPLQRAAAQNNYADHSVLATGQWYKIPVATTGIYRLTANDLPQLEGTAINAIALYGNPGDMLPESNRTAVPDDLRPDAIKVSDANGNGRFDTGDTLYFFGEGPDVWRYENNERLKRFIFNKNAYATHNYYYLTLTGQADSLTRIQSYQPAATNDVRLTTYTAVALCHEDKLNIHGSGQLWMAEKYTPGSNTHSHTLDLPGTILDGEVQLRYALGCLTSANATFNVRAGNDSRQHTFNAYTTYNTFAETFNNLGGSSVPVSITFSPTEGNATGYLDYIEANCQAALEYHGGQQPIRNSQLTTDGTASHFVFNSATAIPQVWDVTDPSQPVATALFTETNGKKAFLGATDKPRTYWAFTPRDAMTPSNITAIDNQDLHGSEVPDFIIVTHHKFLPQAERLADLHRIHDGLSAMVVTQEQVFNEFSSGKTDPTAIRLMMRCMKHKATRQGTTPTRYLLLFGKGTYDNRDLLGTHLNTVVTYESPESFDGESESYPSDDYFGHIEEYYSNPFEGTLSIGIGRLPAKNEAEADHLVDKIEDYMTRGDLTDSTIRGDWRNYVCLLADDADPSCPGDSVFASDSEITARSIKQHYPTFNLDRIYADSYIQQSGADGSYYPDATNALRQRMNYGCLLLNYIGHGSIGYIGTERYMEIPDIERYTNTHRLAFCVASTCSFARHDQPDEVSGAETFLLADNAGIGIIAAARPIHHTQRFDTDLCLKLLDPANTVGDALRMAKNNTAVANSILLLGDPALHLSLPQNKVVVTHINGQPIDSLRTDSATVLSRVVVEGEIRTADGHLHSNFNGIIYPIVFDREVKCHTLANDNDSTEVAFVQQNNILYKGREQVTAGHFSYSFIVPRDVAYRYDFAKLSHYAHNDIEDAGGQYGNIMFGGFNDSIDLSPIYPTVRLFVGDTNFRDGGITNETPTLYALLSDSVGINAAGSGLGHDITAVIDGNPYSTVTLNSFFEPDINDSRNGVVRYTLGKLDNGPHTLTVKCWNIFNYSGSATIHFRVANDKTSQIGLFAAAPNPSHLSTRLRIEHNLPGTVASAQVEIYDMRGRCVRQFTPAATEGSNVLVCDWDFTTDSGAQLPCGIYTARVVLTDSNGNQLSDVAKIIRN